jgi:hypothetical protein
MNFLDWLQVTFTLVVLLIGLYIALARAPGRRVLASALRCWALVTSSGALKVPPSKLRCSPASKQARRWWGCWWCSEPCSGRRAADNKAAAECPPG